jgi:hypothetical protein
MSMMTVMSMMTGALVSAAQRVFVNNLGVRVNRFDLC